MAVSKNDPLESFLNSIQVAFSPLESNFRKAAKNFEHCFNGVVKNGRLHVAAGYNVKNSSRNVAINVGEREKGEVPIKIFLGMFTGQCGSSDNNSKFNFRCDEDEKLNLNLSKRRLQARDGSDNGVNAKGTSNGNRLRFEVALSFLINGLVQTFLSQLKAGKMGVRNKSNKDSSHCEDSHVRVEVKQSVVGGIKPKDLKGKEGKDLPLDHLMGFVLDQFSSFPKFDMVAQDREYKLVNRFEHFKALTSILEGKIAGTKGFSGNLKLARVGGGSSLLGVPSKEDVGEECDANDVNREKSGGNTTQVEIPTDGVLKSALAGGISCAFSTLLMHPVDTVKTQVQASTTLSFTEILSKLPQLGVRGLYMGVIPAIVGQFSSHGLRTGICEASKIALINVAPGLPEIQLQSVASFLGTFLGTTMRIPCEVLKQRLQAGQFNHVGEALVGTWQQAGPGGFFCGTGMTLCRELPFYVAGTSLYVESKKAVQKLLGRELEPWETIAVGAISGGLTAVMTTPFDVIKTRMMTALQGQPTTMSFVALSILRHEGPLGLFRGAVPRFFWVAPLGAINFAGYELIRKAMD